MLGASRPCPADTRVCRARRLQGSAGDGVPWPWESRWRRGDGVLGLSFICSSAAVWPWAGPFPSLGFCVPVCTTDRGELIPGGGGAPPCACRVSFDLQTELSPRGAPLPRPGTPVVVVAGGAPGLTWVGAGDEARPPALAGTAPRRTTPPLRLWCRSPLTSPRAVLQVGHGGHRKEGGGFSVGAVCPARRPGGARRGRGLEVQLRASASALAGGGVAMIPACAGRGCGVGDGSPLPGLGRGGGHCSSPPRRGRGCGRVPRTGARGRCAAQDRKPRVIS